MLFAWTPPPPPSPPLNCSDSHFQKCTVLRTFHSAERLFCEIVSLNISSHHLLHYFQRHSGIISDDVSRFSGANEYFTRCSDCIAPADSIPISLHMFCIRVAASAILINLFLARCLAHTTQHAQSHNARATGVHCVRFV